MVTRINLFVIFCILLLPPKFAAAQGKPSYYWWRGKEKVFLEVVPDHLVELRSPGTAKSNFPYKVLSEKKVSGGVRMVQIHRGDFVKALNGKSSLKLKLSPLFRQGGEVKALAGGVFLVFKVGTDDLEMQKFCDSKSLVVSKKFPSSGRNNPIWLVNSDVGMNSLTLANTLTENNPGLLESARPNFWQPISSRELKGSDFRYKTDAERK